MKILVVGDWHSELHEEAVYRAFVKLGHECYRFSWHEYFKSQKRLPAVNFLETIIKKSQNKFIAGPLITRINRDLLFSIDQYKPDLIFIYRGTHIRPETLHLIKKKHPSSVLIGYNNDDPFAEGHPYWLWRHFLAAIPSYDIMLAYRIHNLDDFRRAGAKETQLLRSWYIPERNYPYELSSEEKYQYESDVVFIGHYETDWRLDLLESIVKQGHKLQLYGPGYDWDPVLAKSAVLRQYIPVKLVWGDEYNKALCGAKVALCFLSKLNRDTYTRRCFEIPATSTLILSEFTEDLASLFIEGKEAEFFRSKEELLRKLDFYIKNNELRRAVAEAGYQRVLHDRHDVVSRMQQVLDWTEKVQVRKSLKRIYSYT